MCTFTCKNQDQRSAASIDRVEADGQTDTTDRITDRVSEEGNAIRLESESV